MESTCPNLAIVGSDSLKNGVNRVRYRWLDGDCLSRSLTLEGRRNLSQGILLGVLFAGATAGASSLQESLDGCDPLAFFEVLGNNSVAAVTAGHANSFSCVTMTGAISSVDIDIESALTEGATGAVRLRFLFVTSNVDELLCPYVRLISVSSQTTPLVPVASS